MYLFAVPENDTGINRAGKLRMVTPQTVYSREGPMEGAHVLIVCNYQTQETVLYYCCLVVGHFFRFCRLSHQCPLEREKMVDFWTRTQCKVTRHTQCHFSLVPLNPGWPSGLCLLWPWHSCKECRPVMLWDPPQVRLVCFLMIRLGQLLQRLLSNDDFLIPLLPYSFIDSHQYRFVESCVLQCIT